MEQQWVIERVRPGAESKVRDFFASLGYESALPMVTLQRFNRRLRKMVEREVPRFPGYLFKERSGFHVKHSLSMGPIRIGGDVVLVSDEEVYRMIDAAQPPEVQVGTIARVLVSGTEHPGVVKELTDEVAMVHVATDVGSVKMTCRIGDVMEAASGGMPLSIGS